MDLASAEAEIRHVFGDTPITEASIGAAPPDILVKLSVLHTLLYDDDHYTLSTLFSSYNLAQYDPHNVDKQNTVLVFVNVPFGHQSL